MNDLLRTIQALLQSIQTSRKGSMGSIENTYLPQLNVDNVNLLAARVTQHLLTQKGVVGEMGSKLIGEEEVRC